MTLSQPEVLEKYLSCKSIKAYFKQNECCMSEYSSHIERLSNVGVEVGFQVMCEVFGEREQYE